MSHPFISGLFGMAAGIVVQWILGFAVVPDAWSFTIAGTISIALAFVWWPILIGASKEELE